MVGRAAKEKRMRGILRKHVSRFLGILLLGTVVLSAGCQKETEEGFRELASEETDEKSSVLLIERLGREGRN